MFSNAHLTSHSRMSGSRWVITPLWLSGLWRPFLCSSVYSCHLFLISSASVRSIPFLSFIEPIFAAKKARQYCWVMHRGWSHHHSLSPHTPASAAEQKRGWTIKHLTHKTTQWDFTWGAPLGNLCADYRVGLQPRDPSMCLIHWTMEKDPRKGSPLSTWTGSRAREKKGRRGLLIASNKRFKKCFDRVITPEVQTVHVVHTWSSQG